MTVTTKEPSKELEHENMRFLKENYLIIEDKSVKITVPLTIDMVKSLKQLMPKLFKNKSDQRRQNLSVTASTKPKFNTTTWSKRLNRTENGKLPIEN